MHAMEIWMHEQINEWVNLCTLWKRKWHLLCCSPTRVLSLLFFFCFSFTHPYSSNRKEMLQGWETIAFRVSWSHQNAPLQVRCESLLIFLTRNLSFAAVKKAGRAAGSSLLIWISIIFCSWSRMIRLHTILSRYFLTSGMLIKIKLVTYKEKIIMLLFQISQRINHQKLDQYKLLWFKFQISSLVKFMCWYIGTTNFTKISIWKCN